MLRTRKLGMFLVASSLALGFAAGLAVGQMKPPAENKGLGAEALRSLDLTEEIDSVRGRPLRMRKITLAPGGVGAHRRGIRRGEGDHALGGEPRQRAGGVDRGRYSDHALSRDYSGFTFDAAGPFCPCVTSKETFWPSFSDLKPAAWIEL